MFTTLFLITLFVAINSEVSPLNENNEWYEFFKYQDNFDKKYNSLQELHTRFAIFKDNINFIVNHNIAGNSTFTLGVNQFTDMSIDEFKAYINNAYKPVQSFGCSSFSSSASSAPVSIDWRQKNVVNPIRDQGQCGSCWSFATTANAESVWAIHSSDLLDLSEQYLVDCASGAGYYNMGCNGGNPDSAFKYMINNF
jgi:C1A family cysteine protease